MSCAMTFLNYICRACGGFQTYCAFLNLSVLRTISYWAFLSALLAAVATINVIHLVRKGIGYVPEFRIEKGEAYAPMDQPFFAHTDQFPIIIDTSETLQDFQKQFSTGLIIRKKEVVYWKGDESRISFPLHVFPDGVVDAFYLDRLSRDLPVSFPATWLCLMLFGLAQAFLFAVFANLLESTISPGYTFKQLWNLAVFALTPPSIVVAFYASIQFFGVPYPLLYLSCYCFFLVMATGACRTALEKAPPTDQEE